MLVVIVASGATVRMTGSGLGCEHWPGCQAGDPFPKTGYHSYVEFSNRIIASFAIILTLATFLVSLLVTGVKHWTRWVAGLAFFGTFLQAPLGAITVYYKLNPWLVGSHFLLSIVVLTLGVLVALEAWDIRGDPVSASIRGLALTAGVACGALILSGVLMLRHLGETDAAERVEDALREVIAEGKSTTYDLGGTAGTSDMADAIVARLDGGTGARGSTGRDRAGAASASSAVAS